VETPYQQFSCSGFPPSYSVKQHVKTSACRFSSECNKRLNKYSPLSRYKITIYYKAQTHKIQ